MVRRRFTHIGHDVDEPGISIDDLPGIYREEYLYAMEVARGQHDPCLEWDDFRETLWRYLVRVFGIEDVTATTTGT